MTSPIAEDGVKPDLEDAIRRAVACGEFVRAASLWEAYGLRCREEMRAGSNPRATLERAHQLMSWCRLIALAARAQAQAQLDRLAQRSRIASAYGLSSSPPPGSIRAARY